MRRDGLGGVGIWKNTIRKNTIRKDVIRKNAMRKSTIRKNAAVHTTQYAVYSAQYTFQGKPWYLVRNLN